MTKLLDYVDKDTFSQIKGDLCLLMTERKIMCSPEILSVLGAVAHTQALTMQQIGANTGMSLASVSRNLSALNKYHRFGKPGMNWTETAPDPTERRRLIVFLTAEGCKTLSSLITNRLGQPHTLKPISASDFLKAAYNKRQT